MMKDYQGLADDLLPLFDNMPSVTIRFVDYIGPSEYKSSDSRGHTCGYYSKKSKQIFISDDCCNSHQVPSILLKHEMTHRYLDWLGKDCGHTTEFSHQFSLALTDKEFKAVNGCDKRDWERPDFCIHRSSF